MYDIIIHIAFVRLTKEFNPFIPSCKDSIPMHRIPNRIDLVLNDYLKTGSSYQGKGSIS